MYNPNLNPNAKPSPKPTPTPNPKPRPNLNLNPNPNPHQGAPAEFDELLTLGIVSALQRPERRAGVHLDRSVLYVATTATFMKGCGGCRESAGGRRGAGCQPLEATAPLPLWTSGRLPQLWASPTRVSRG